MLLDHLKIAFRYFEKARIFTFLNVTGLVIGIALFVLISMLLNYELTFDGFHPNKNKILQVCEHDLKSGEFQANTGLPLPLTLKNDFPEVKYVTGVKPVLNEETRIKYENIEYSGFTGASVDPDFFSIFGYRLILGDIHTALNSPDQIAVSKSLAQKIFGNTNPVGKTLTLQNYSFTISHLFDDIPENSSVKFDILFSDQILEIITPDYKVAWWNGGIQTYVILQDNFSVQDFDRNLKTIPQRYYPDFLVGRSTYFTIPFAGSHFDASILNGNQPAVSYTYLFILGSISFIILIIACLNYVNLTFARAFKLRMDAGIRRINGAHSNNIVSVHVISAFLIVFTALILAIPVVRVSLPFFEKLAERQLTQQLTHLNVWLFTLIVLTVVAIISGYVPGRIFSKVKPDHIIKTRESFIGTNRLVHHGLLIFQLSLTIVLIISQLFIIKQISFMKNGDLGFDNNNLVSVEVRNIDAGYAEKYNKSRLYKDVLEKQGTQYGLTEGTITENIPGYYYQNSFTVNPVNSAINECLVVSTAVDENFSEVFQVDVVDGRFFSEEYGTDRTAFIINETAMRRFGWNEIEGKFIKLGQEGDYYPIVGVLKDIHITTLKQPISPMVYRFGQHNNFPAFLTFRIVPGKESEALALMQKVWENMFPESLFSYLDVKETYYENYKEEQRLSKIVGTFALLAVVLSLFGLSGLILFHSERRTKEIGVRKVNGARAYEVMAMLNKDFVKWVGAAFVIATPIAYYVMNKWLQNFAYKTGLSWWIFALAGVVAMGITLLTVSWQSYRAASRNPVEALRYE